MNIHCINKGVVRFKGRAIRTHGINTKEKVMDKADIDKPVVIDLGTQKKDSMVIDDIAATRTVPTANLAARVYKLVNMIFDVSVEDIKKFEVALTVALDCGVPLDDKKYSGLRMKYIGSRAFFEGGGLEDWLEILGLNINRRPRVGLWKLDRLISKVEEKDIKYRRLYVYTKAR